MEHPLDSLTAEDVARGLGRMFFHMGHATLTEVSLRNGRRADLVAVDAKGGISIVEIKVAVADLRGDNKWPDYLEFCDRFYWAIPNGFPAELLEDEDYAPKRAGLIIADSYDAAIVREAAETQLNAARRRTEILRFGRTAAQRLLRHTDPQGD